MLGVKLRSENVDQFDVLGERGQAIHLVASQILTVLKGKRPDLLANFAVPQPSENGTRIDWYAPGPGTVVAWNAATETEQSRALTRLESVRAGVAQLRESVQAKGTGNDAALLGQLLKWILHHPDNSFVYLVDGQPVITFWGFVHSGADRSLDPLHALRPSAFAESVPQAPLASTATQPPLSSPALPQLVATAPWWKRWWMWLLLLLALLALLFGLRACMPGLAPSVSLPVDTARAPAPRDVARPHALPELTPPSGVSHWSAPVANGGGASSGLPATAGSSLPGGTPPAPAMGTPGGAAPAVAGADRGAPATPPSAAPAAPPSVADAASVPSTPPVPEASASPSDAAPSENKDALQIPADAGEGNADFLNGNWRAGAGIQDRDTGQPLRLHYQFKNGEGNVTLNRHNGVQCSAPVSAALSKGSLMISNSVAAQCSDGGTYEMPQIQCQPGASSIASCAGNYGDTRFPISMRRAQP